MISNLFNQNPEIIVKPTEEKFEKGGAGAGGTVEDDVRGKLLEGLQGFQGHSLSLEVFVYVYDYVYGFGWWKKGGGRGQE